LRGVEAICELVDDGQQIVVLLLQLRRSPTTFRLTR
jgi:hypothetical protein